jgi:Undecaprenyl-phosphate galactose phosphotransferase WbaP
MALAYDRSGVAATLGRGQPPLEGLGRNALGLPGRIVMLASLLVADVVALQAAILLGPQLHRLIVAGSFSVSSIDARMALAALVLPIGYALLDVYRVHGRAPIERFPLRIKATFLLFALLAGWHYSHDGAKWPLGAIGLAFLFAMVLPLVTETVVRGLLLRHRLWGVPAVVIGAGPTGQQVVRVLKEMPELGLRPVALFDDQHGAEWSPPLVEGVPVLGSIADSARYSRGIETAIVTTPTRAPETVGAVAMQLGYRDIIVVPDLRDIPTLWVRTNDFSGLIGLQMRRNLLLRRNRLIKRTIDYLVAVPLFVLSAPFVALLALWIKLQTNGPPFYAQTRAGKAGRMIKVWKLRTMYPDAEQRLQLHLRDNPAARERWERYSKLTDDPRILPGIGTFLRRTSLDELPQIFNVIRGEMSLVGPRPFPGYHLDRFDASFRSLRASVIPGITGLWQVSARSDGDLQVQQALDTYYIRNWSIWIDFYILSRTLAAVLAGRGAR